LQGDELPRLVPEVRPPSRPPNPHTIWGLNEEDSFTVSVNIEKKTTVRIGDAPETTSTTNDHLTLYYHVVQVTSDKDCLMAVQIGLGDRNVTPTSPDPLQVASKTPPATENQAFGLVVSPDGTARVRSPKDVPELLRSLAIADPKVERLLSETCPEDVIVGWLARPFLITPRPGENASEQTWSQPVSIAMGNFGSVVLDAEMTLKPKDEEYSVVSISGKGRFRPLVVPEKLSETRSLLLSQVMVDLDEFSGTARVWKPVSKEKQANDVRPMLEDLNMTCRIHGSGLLEPDAAKAQKVSFEQVQVQSWLVTSHNIGLPEYRLPTIPFDAR
jgi:hypothetical protein